MTTTDADPFVESMKSGTNTNGSVFAKTDSEETMKTIVFQNVERTPISTTIPMPVSAEMATNQMATMAASRNPNVLPTPPSNPGQENVFVGLDSRKRTTSVFQFVPMAMSSTTNTKRSVLNNAMTSTLTMISGRISVSSALLTVFGNHPGKNVDVSEDLRRPMTSVFQPAHQEPEGTDMTARSGDFLIFELFILISFENKSSIVHID